MSSGPEDSRSTLLRASKGLRASAWLPPGLALAWLAILATLVRNVGIMIADWAATVGLVVLIVLLVRRRRAPPSVSSEAPGSDESNSPRDEVPAAGGAGVLPAAPASASVNVVMRPPPPVAVPDLAILDLRVLTAEEVAALLRVNLDEIIASITKGELPGNRIGTKWRVEQRALARWLEGPYGGSR